MKRSNLLALYAVSFVIGTAIFVDLFHTGLFGFVDVFFYRGIALLLFSCALMGVVLLTVWKRIPNVISLKDIYIILLTILSVNLLFFTHVPVTGERSISIFLLGYMNKNANKIITKEDLTQAFFGEYMGTDNNIQKRIHEQLVTGDIAPWGNGYTLTTQGKLLMQMYSVVDKLFGIRR